VGVLSSNWEEEETGFMTDSHSLLRGPNFYLILGIIFLAAGVVSTCTGEVWGRFGSVVYRAEEPEAFWEDVIGCYLIGVGCIGYFLYQVYAP
jgi:hypothetical protein